MQNNWWFNNKLSNKHGSLLYVVSFMSHFVCVCVCVCVCERVVESVQKRNELDVTFCAHVSMRPLVVREPNMNLKYLN